MSIAINEFARRICMANHSMNHADPAFNRVPCGTHMTIARSTWGLTEATGMKTLGVINAIADETGLIAAVERDPHTQAVMKLVGKGDPSTLTAEDWDRYLNGPVNEERDRILAGTPADVVEGGS